MTPEIEGHDSPMVMIADALLRDEGLIYVLHAYYDESYGDEGIFSVAGYAFKRSRLKPFERKWAAMLKRYDIPYFRMSSCAHGNGVFKDVSKERRIACQGEVIKLIGEFAAKGFAVTTHARIYEALSVRMPEDGCSSYEFCCWAAVLNVRKWMMDKQWNNRALYFFEAGHATRSQTHKLMDTIAASTKLRELYRYAGHAFVRKEQTGAVQAADMLAWHARKDVKNQLESRPRRKDLTALAEATPHSFSIADPSHHGDYVRDLERRGIRPTFEEFLATEPADFFG